MKRFKDLKEGSDYLYDNNEFSNLLSQIIIKKKKKGKLCLSFFCFA